MTQAIEMIEESLKRTALGLGTSLVALSLLTSCKGCDHPRTDHDAAPDVADSAAPPRPPSGDVVDGGAEDASPKTSADATVSAERMSDAGATSCRLVYGPAEQPFRGPAAISVALQELRLVANDAGRPRVYSVAIPPVPPKGVTPADQPPPETVVAMRWPPCALAGRFAYCQAPGGAIVRSVLGSQEPGKTVAKSRSGTRITAAPLGPDHAVVAFLDVRHTTEGEVLQAFVVTDDGEPMRVSEDGAGATTLRFLPRGGSPTLVYLDARSSMVPVHARPMSLRGDELVLGTDSVIFIGGAPERGIDFAAATAGPKSFVFIPMPRDTIDFGMATLRVEDPPKDDVSAIWSHYPNGLDPAPIAASAARDGSKIWVVRVRPRERAPGSPHIVELGRVDASGNFASHGEIAPGRDNKLSITDVALVEDGAGAVWISYGDATSTWLERRICP